MQPTPSANCPTIEADDSTLRAALEDANIPSLMNALVHITGDTSLLEGSIRPDVAAFVDQQCGISEEQQHQAREIAFNVLKTFRDNGSKIPRQLEDQEIQEMVGWMVGVPLPPVYTEFLVQELALRRQDPYATPSLEHLDEATRKNFHVAIVGAGMSGILAAHRLDQAGISYTVFDKNPEVGGTWFENTYPGCRVDSPNHTYCYSFQPNAWPNYYSTAPVLKEYFNTCADTFGIRPNIRLNTKVRSAHWDKGKSRWQLTVVEETGDKASESTKIPGNTEIIEANALISAVGQLNRPTLPAIDGLGTFTGPAFHSARWDHTVELEGKRVGVIGTGASAFQFIPEIAKKAKRVTVFQRTPPWVRPTDDYHQDVSAEKHWLLENIPFYAKWYRFLMFWLTAEGMLEATKIDPSWDNGGLSVSPANEELRQLLLENLSGHLADQPELLKKATPKYPPGGKRMLFDNGTWLSALRQENVDLVTAPISRITNKGVNTSQGEKTQEHTFDVLIYGTGFETNRMLSSYEIRGGDGEVLQETWEDDPKAYLGITVPNFPNFFCLYGPNTNIVVNGSIIFFSECEVRYTLECLHLLMEGEHRSMQPRPEVLNAYIESIDQGNRERAWGEPRVRSWYKNAAGRVTQNWPFSLVEFWAQTQKPNRGDFFID